jgi:L-threonylcarbamoyladenylate synthase
MPEFDTRIAPTDEPPMLHTAVEEAVALLRSGEVVALPTETVYGLAADALNPAAVAKIFEAKERPTFDPLIVHLAHKKQLDLVAEVPPAIAALVQQLTDRFWPGPLTLLLPKKPSVPDLVTAGLPTVAVRVSSNPIFRRVATALDKPLAAPSANRFGSISPTSAPAVLSELAGRIPLILDGGASLHGLESTIIRIEPAQPKPIITIVRPGPLTPEDLKPYGRVQLGARTVLDDSATEAPGQLAKHYAPRTPLRLLTHPSDFQPEEGKSYALLSLSGEDSDGYVGLHDWEEVMMLSPGSGKLPEAAVRFFHCLRRLDEMGVDEIIAEPLHEHGMGIAMMDKLRRASVNKPPPVRGPAARHPQQRRPDR